METFEGFSNEKLSSNVKESDDSFMDLWRPQINHFVRNLSDLVQRVKDTLD